MNDPRDTRPPLDGPPDAADPVRTPDGAADLAATPGWGAVGDLGYLDDDGYLYLTGRASQMIITGGVNVHPREVELLLSEHPEVDDVAVVGVPDDEFGERVTAVVVPTGKVDLDEARVLGGLETRLARFKLPKRVVFVDELPRNTMGKVQKNLLREEFADLYRS